MSELRTVKLHAHAMNSAQSVVITSTLADTCSRLAGNGVNFILLNQPTANEPEEIDWEKKYWLLFDAIEELCDDWEGGRGEVGPSGAVSLGEIAKTIRARTRLH